MFLYLILAVALLSGALMFVEPKKVFIALSLAGLYTVFLRPFGFKEYVFVVIFLIFFIVFWLGIALYGHREEIEEES